MPVYMSIAQILLGSPQFREQLPLGTSGRSHSLAKELMSSSRTTGKSPLRVAASLNVHQMAKLLMGQGAGIHCTDVAEKSPIQKAVTSGNLEIVRLLIDKRADINCTDNAGEPQILRAV